MEVVPLQRQKEDGRQLAWPWIIIRHTRLLHKCSDDWRVVQQPNHINTFGERLSIPRYYSHISIPGDFTPKTTFGAIAAIHYFVCPLCSDSTE